MLSDLYKFLPHFIALKRVIWLFIKLQAGCFRMNMKNYVYIMVGKSNFSFNFPYSYAYLYIITYIYFYVAFHSFLSKFKSHGSKVN